MKLWYTADYKKGLSRGLWTVTYYCDKKVVFKCQAGNAKDAHRKFEDRRIGLLAQETGKEINQIRLEFGYKI